MRSAEHFWKASDSVFKVVALFFDLELLGLGRESAQGQSKIMLSKAMMSSVKASMIDRAVVPTVSVTTVNHILTDCSLVLKLKK